MFITPASKFGPGVYSRKWPSTPPLTIVNLIGTQAISNNAWNLISWDTVERDDAHAFDLAVKSQIIVPAWCRHARFTFSAIWASSSTGSRSMLISNSDETNGGPFGVTIFKSECDSTASLDSTNRTTTGIIAIQPRKKIQAWVFQNTGGNLNFGGTNGGTNNSDPAYLMAEWYN